MGDLAARLASFVHNKSGAVASEYVLLLVVVGVFAVAVVLLVGALTGVLQNAADCVEVGCV